MKLSQGITTHSVYHWGVPKKREIWNGAECYGVPPHVLSLSIDATHTPLLTLRHSCTLQQYDLSHLKYFYRKCLVPSIVQYPIHIQIAPVVLKKVFFFLIRGKIKIHTLIFLRKAAPSHFSWHQIFEKTWPVDIWFCLSLLWKDWTCCPSRAKIQVPLTLSSPTLPSAKMHTLPLHGNFLWPPAVYHNI